MKTSSCERLIQRSVVPARTLNQSLQLPLRKWCARTVQVKTAFKKLSLEHHPDRVSPEKRKSAQAQFSKVTAAYNDALRQYGRDGRPAINLGNINAVREARQASGSKMVWLSPIVVPLLMTFGAVGFITYMQASKALDHTRRNHRPYGILGPAVNEFIRDRPDDDKSSRPTS